MKLPYCIRTVVAASLLLLFTLQAGVGLFLHNAFHQSVNDVQVQPNKKNGFIVSAASTNFSCTCVDDFLVPFSSIDPPSLPQPFFTFFILPQADYYNYLPHSLRIFRSLRAPPVSVS